MVVLLSYRLEVKRDKVVGDKWGADPVKVEDSSCLMESFNGHKAANTEYCTQFGSIKFDLEFSKIISLIQFQNSHNRGLFIILGVV